MRQPCAPYVRACFWRFLQRKFFNRRNVTKLASHPPGCRNVTQAS
jgi:hypothetical protein